MRPRKVEGLFQSCCLGRGGVGTGSPLTSRSAPQLLHPTLWCPGMLTCGIVLMGTLTLCFDQWGAMPADGRQRGEGIKALIPSNAPCGVATVWLWPSTETTEMLRQPLHSKPFWSPPQASRPSSGIDGCPWSRFLQIFPIPCSYL